MFINFLKDEKGIALPIVVLLIAVLTIAGFSAANTVMNQGKIIGKEINKMEALNYAEAGVHEYLGHINKITNIPWDKWDVNIPFGNGFFNLKMQEDNLNKLEKTFISTGWEKDNESDKVTIKVTIGRVAFNQYSYFSEKDSYTVVKYDRRGKPNGTKEQEVVWATGEKCYGPYHTNNTLFISGSPVFYDLVTYVRNIENANKTNYSIFKKGTLKVPEIVVPATNYELKEKALENGHYYKGRTRILLNGNSYDVKYFDEVANIEKEKRGLDLPPNGVIYIDGGSGDLNKFDKRLGNLFISGELSGELTIGTANNIYITGNDPTSNVFGEYKIDTNWWGQKTITWTKQIAAPTPKNLTQGITYSKTTFVEKKEGTETIGYQRNSNAGDDLLGLVANKDIIILGTGWFDEPNNSYFNVAPQDITVHGAIFAMGGGLTYEDYEKFPKGQITLRGSLIQKERKPVGQVTGNGYKKNYAHDPEMLYSTPPSFPEPLNTGWEIKEWEVLNRSVSK